MGKLNGYGDGPANAETLVEMFDRWDAALARRWSKWREEAELAFGMVAGGSQWGKEDREVMEAQGRVAAVMNDIDPIVSAICGSEITNRQEIRYYPREVSQREQDGRFADAQVSELLTGAVEWVRDETDAAEEESAAFRNAIICGLGVLELRMDYEIDPEGIAVTQSIDPLEIAICAAAVRPNAIDARYVRRRKRFDRQEAAELFQMEPDAVPSVQGREDDRQHDNYPGSAYTHETIGADDDDSETVVVDEYQWFTSQRVAVVVHPQTGQEMEVQPDQLQELLQAVPDLQYAMVPRRQYWRAYRVGSEVLLYEPLPDGEFTYKFVTGKWDRNERTWYGVVRACIDPQRIKNKLISQMVRIIDTSAKGGLLAEVDAFEDPAQAREDWAASDSIVLTQSGALSGGKIIPKPVGQYPPAIDRLFGVVNDAVINVTGVNREMLGLIDREQAGVVEYQRKQAAYGVLAGFFDSLRRYRKLAGRHLLKLIQNYMSDGRIVRINGKGGNIKYLPLVRDPQVRQYDVIVDEAPSGPNQKEKVWQFLMGMAPFLSRLNLPLPVWLKLMEYSPVPSSLVQDIEQTMQAMPQQEDPNAIKAKADAQAKQAELQMRGMEMQAQMQADQQKAAMDQEIARMRIQGELELQRAKAQQQIETERMIASEKMRLAREQAAFEAQMAQEKMDFEAQLARQKLDMQQTAGAISGGGVDANFGGEVG